MNYEGLDFDFFEIVVKMAGGVFEGKRLEIGEGGKENDLAGVSEEVVADLEEMAPSCITFSPSQSGAKSLGEVVVTRQSPLSSKYLPPRFSPHEPTRSGV